MNLQLMLFISLILFLGLDFFLKGLKKPKENKSKVAHFEEAPFNYYIKNLFLEEIWLFMPAFILVVFFAWYISDRIKAR